MFFYFFSGKEAQKLLAKVDRLKKMVSHRDKIIWNLKREKKTWQSKMHRNNLVRSELTKYFTPNQTRQILTQKRVRWSEEDIVKGLMLCSLSKKSYQFIRRKKLFPVPSISALRKWVSNINCVPGILQDVLTILKKQIIAEANENYKLGVLVFDEIDLKKKYEYFKKQDCVFPAHKKAQVAMIRGLCSDWKQPVFFDFDTPMRTNLLFDIISKIEETGIEVWAMTSDGGTSNQALLKQLGITTEKTYFTNPADPTRNIYVFADIPHLLKLIRNHILDFGIQIDGEDIIINKNDFVDILDRDRGEFKIHPKLTEFHISCSGSQRQRVRPAAQLLSHTSAVALRSLSSHKNVQADFVELINNWYIDLPLY